MKSGGGGGVFQKVSCEPGHSMLKIVYSTLRQENEIFHLKN